jgi:large subunit ribosomal protein L31
MKKDIHPVYYTDTKVTCACGNTWVTGSTKKEIRTEVCSKCHPFFTGEQARLMDIEGQVERFKKRVKASLDYKDVTKKRSEERTSPDRPVEELELGKRSTEALLGAGLKTVGQVLEKLEGGETSLLELSGFGRKSLIDLKKKLRTLGYKLPAAAEEINV